MYKIKYNNIIYKINYNIGGSNVINGVNVIEIKQFIENQILNHQRF